MPAVRRRSATTSRRGTRIPTARRSSSSSPGEPSIKTAETDVPIRWVAIRGDEAAGEEDEVVETSDSVMYVLCGTGENCAIDEGEPSADRYRLLRREALELALYSFKYTDADSVIALLPPSTDTDTETTRRRRRRSSSRRTTSTPSSRGRCR